MINIFLFLIFKIIKKNIYKIIEIIFNIIKHLKLTNNKLKLKIILLKNFF